MITKKEYVAQYQHKKDAGSDKWSNAVWYCTGKRTTASREIAERCLEKIVNTFNKGERIEKSGIGYIGVSTHIDASTADSLSIVATRIRVREVTDWEDC